MKPMLVVLIGLPSSGKSTYSAKMKEIGFNIHASDELRVELYGNVNTFDKNAELFKELHNRIKRDLSDGKSVVYDATNINRKKRMAFLSEISKIDCVKKAVVMATPYNMCVQTDKLREKKVGYNVIKNMYFSFQMPMIQEGFDSIELEYNPMIYWEENEYAFMKEFKLLDEIKQFNEHHKLTIGGHSRKVFDLLCNVDEANAELRWAGWMHDVGKRKTMSFMNSRGEFTKDAHFYNHESVSAYDSLFYFGADYDRMQQRLSVVKIATYISEHMKIHTLEGKALEKYKEFVGEQFWNDLVIFNKADTEAKE